MKKTLHLETSVYLDMFYAKAYTVAIDRIDGVWKFNDPWTRASYENSDLGALLVSVEDARRARRDELAADLDKRLNGRPVDWPLEPGQTVTYANDNGRLLATVLCVHGGDADKLRYLVQLHHLPAFLSTPFEARGKKHLRSILEGVRLQMFCATNDVAPELRKAFAEFAKEA